MTYAWRADPELPGLACVYRVGGPVPGHSDWEHVEKVADFFGEDANENAQKVAQMLNAQAVSA